MAKELAALAASVGQSVVNANPRVPRCNHKVAEVKFHCAHNSRVRVQTIHHNQTLGVGDQSRWLKRLKISSLN